ncbi:uncharacterized protein LOC127136323 [Lathyrus oleraceus]|uniref:uncharacterized protein LOC127136323 n=1 Tax=Pisum sativum TaxID=3888 RepID=UPI0021D1B7CE|nr:uncharacterized protein LOC127136323 [Pisum sativum]
MKKFVKASNFKGVTCRSEIETIGREVSASLICFKCGGLVRRAADCKSVDVVEIVLFPEFEESIDSRFISTSQVKEFLKDEAQVFTMFSSLQVGSKASMVDLPMICEFLEVFPYDITDLPPEREVEFTIDSVPDTRPVSMAPYRMSPIELGELKKQL